MKTTATALTTYGNCTLVQLAVHAGSAFAFKPGGPEMRNGGLVITETGGNGVVGQLVAVNNTASFLLLTDADFLTGAKQNRILNKSVLLPPFSKTMLDVSCIERGRWHFTSQNFSSPDMVADHDLRKSKARTVAGDPAQPKEVYQTQQKVWSHIAGKMQEERCLSVTENYSDLVSHLKEKQKSGIPNCQPEEGCNGLAVLVDRKVACIDIFGSEEAYRHYFPKLRDSAFLQAAAGRTVPEMGMPEAYYKVTEMLNGFDSAEKIPDSKYSGAGSLVSRATDELLGFELVCDGQLIHCSLFGK